MPSAQVPLAKQTTSQTSGAVSTTFNPRHSTKISIHQSITMTTYPEKHFGITCPSGSKFFANPTAKIPFIGCCQEDMLTGDCPEDKLLSMSFNYSNYNDIPPQDCVAAANGAKWYVCADSQPTFLGCCDIDACGFRGCPSALVRSARLSQNPRFARQFMGVSNGVSSSSSSSMSRSTKSSSSSTSQPSTTTPARGSTTSTTDLSDPTAPPVPQNLRGGMASGAIGGIAVGSIAGVLGLGLLFFWIFRMARNRSNPFWHSSPTDSSWEAKFSGPSPASATTSQQSSLQRFAAIGTHSPLSSQPRQSTNVVELPATPVRHTNSVASSVWDRPSYSGHIQRESPLRSH